MIQIAVYIKPRRSIKIPIYSKQVRISRSWISFAFSASFEMFLLINECRQTRIPSCCGLTQRSQVWNFAKVLSVIVSHRNICPKISYHQLKDLYFNTLSREYRRIWRWSTFAIRLFVRPTFVVIKYRHRELNYLKNIDLRDWSLSRPNNSQDIAQQELEATFVLSLLNFSNKID